MGSKNAGKEGRWFNEHGIRPEKKSCDKCGWFVDSCLKWGEKTNPNDSSCHYFQRKRTHKNNKIITYKAKEDIKEEYAYILDILPNGYSSDNRPIDKRPMVQGVGEKNIIFFELIPKKNALTNIQDRVYIGDGNRPTIDHVKKRIPYQELTPSARFELFRIINKLVFINEKRFIRFYNESDWISLNLHILGLLAYISSSKQKRIIQERDKQQFVSFADIERRTCVPAIPAIANRILCELINPVKYLLFIKKDDCTPKQDAPKCEKKGKR